MEQTISLSPYSVDIDNGMVLFNLSAWLGGIDSYGDNARVTLRFLDGMFETIGNITTIGPVFVFDRNKTTSFLFRQNSGLIPIGARYMNVTVIMTQVGEIFNNDGYADNIAVVFSHV
jgi:hypothetical protein